MKNLNIKLLLVNGSVLPFEFSNGKELIEGIYSDDVNPPPSSMLIEATTQDKKIIKINIPYNTKSIEASVTVEEQ